jgi:hypothetical protein
MTDSPSWSELADRAAVLDDQPFSRVSQSASPEAMAAFEALTEAIVAEGVPRRAAEMAVTRWMVLRNPDGTRVPIEDCVREETGEET